MDYLADPLQPIKYPYFLTKKKYFYKFFALDLMIRIQGCVSTAILGKFDNKSKPFSRFEKVAFVKDRIGSCLIKLERVHQFGN